MSRTAWLDRLGITASLGCAIHCVLTALFFLIIPNLFQGLHFTNLTILTSEWIHVGLAVLVFPVAIFALSRGYKTHGNKNSLILGGLGLVFLALGLSLGHDVTEILLTLTGGLLLAAAHLINLRSCQIR